MNGAPQPAGPGLFLLYFLPNFLISFLFLYPGREEMEINQTQLEWHTEASGDLQYLSRVVI